MLTPRQLLLILASLSLSVPANFLFTLYQYFASWVGKMQGIVYFLLLLLLLWGTDGQTCPGGWYLVYDGGYVCRTQRNSNYIHVGQV
jgi:hypothetical protein